MQNAKNVTIEIEALDTLFFRDARPFTMGDETGASGIFPPSPSVLYGALRGAYLAHHPDTFNAAGTEADLTQALKIKNIYLKRDADVFLPLPLDLVAKKHAESDQKEEQQKKRGHRTVYRLTLEEQTKRNLLSSAATDWILPFASHEVVESISDGLLESPFLQEYLNGQLAAFHARKISDCLQKEAKIGIARNDLTHSSQQQALYRFDLQRLEKRGLSRFITTRFVVEFTGLEIPTDGLMKLGGEGKGAHFRQLHEELKIDPPEIQGNCFKLYLLTPAVFSAGWRPAWMQTGVYKDLKLTLLTAATGKSQPLGGFDMKKRIPKALQRAVPAGSVYYVRIESGKIEQVIEYFHGQSLCESETYQKQGFGIAYVGKPHA